MISYLLSLVTKSFKNWFSLYKKIFCFAFRGTIPHLEPFLDWKPGPEVIKLFSCSTQLSMKF